MLWGLNEMKHTKFLEHRCQMSVPFLPEAIIINYRLSERKVLRRYIGRAKTCRESWGFRRQMRVHVGKSLDTIYTWWNNTVLWPWHPGVGRNENLSFRMGPQLSRTLCFPKGLSERSYLLKSTSVTNHSNDIITHMSLLMRISNLLKKLHSQMSQGLDIQITFEEENVNFTYIEKHQKL